MHLVQDQETPQRCRLRSEKGAVLRTHEQVLEHREVGHENVRSTLPQLLAALELVPQHRLVEPELAKEPSRIFRAAWRFTDVTPKGDVRTEGEQRSYPP